MLDNETKRKIDSARSILVGKVPDPKAQVEQITTALIYKFMDDMDREAELLGGKAKFITAELEEFKWANLMAKSIGGSQRLNLYMSALLAFAASANIPEIFRTIFKDAFLPYRDSETLNLFLKEIDYFDYDHSENLGNAFEYLLSILGSQGDAGQFRTPRHIIDFIVEILEPKKDETVLDPACGTAGFLISAYKHIMANNKLVPDEKKLLMQNFTGYDISPDMVRLSLVNMYLHSFPTPKIYEYDTLTSEDRWNDSFDVILANPPFMTPKGGIRPHNRFSVQANRSEVLFVDYIAEHLSLSGRAGIIIPEGIIFQSANAYKALRKMLVENGFLWAVVSLPAGVFQPYSGVKTSVLLLDRSIAKKRDDILFIKISNDGYDLGAQRREINKNDLPEALEILKNYRIDCHGDKSPRSDENGVITETVIASETKQSIALIVPKSKIAESGDYNLTGDRYRDNTRAVQSIYPMVKLGELINMDFGIRITKKDDEGTEYPVYGGGGESFRTNSFNRENEFVISRFAMSENCVRFVNGKFFMMDSGFTFSIKDSFHNLANKQYLGYMFLKNQNVIYNCARGHAQKNLDTNQFKELEIPLPPLEIQNQIIVQIEEWQKIIDGAKQVINSYRPTIDIDPSWEIVKLGNVSTLMTGGTPLTSKKEYYGGNIKWLVSGDINQGEIFNCEGRITDIALKESNAKLLPINSVLIALNGQGKTRGTVAILRTEASCNQSLVSINPDSQKLTPEFLLYVLMDKYKEIREINGDNQRGGLNMPIIRSIQIPLPSFEIQNQIVAKIEKERQAVESCKSLVEIFEAKIKAKIDKVWGKSADE